MKQASRKSTSFGGASSLYFFAYSFAYLQQV
jgi:hypothetical protein